MTDVAESARPTRARRSRAVVGDIIEVAIASGDLVYVHYCSDWGRAAAVRLLPGRWEKRLEAAKLAELAAGPEERVALCALAVFLKGPGVQVVANAPVPKPCRLPPPVVLRWEPDNPGGGLIEGSNHKTYTVSEFEKLHPRVDVAKLPGCAVPVSPLRGAADRSRHPLAGEGQAARVLQRRAPGTGLSAPQLALLELHRDRAEPMLSLWYALARDGGPPAYATIRQLVHEASPSTRASVALCAAQPVAERASEHPSSAVPSERLKAHQERHAYLALFKSHLLGLLAERELDLSADDLDLLYSLDSLTGANPPRVVLRFLAAASRRYFGANPGDPKAVASLDALLVRLQEGGCRNAFWAPLQAVRSGQVRPGELDLAVISTADNFGEPARALAQQFSAAWPGTGHALGYLASARGASPSDRWADGCRKLAGERRFSDLVREVLTLVVGTDAVEAGLGRRRHLLSEVNTYLVRGATWAVPLAEGDWRTSLLGQLALRCGNAMLSRAVSLAAIEALATIGDDAALAELEDLFEEADNPGLLKMAGAAIGASDARISDGVDRLRAVARREADRPWNGHWC